MLSYFPISSTNRVGPTSNRVESMIPTGSIALRQGFREYLWMNLFISCCGFCHRSWKIPMTNSRESRVSCPRCTWMPLKKLAAQKTGKIHWVLFIVKKHFQESCHQITAPHKTPFLCPRSFQPSHHFSVVNRKSNKQDFWQLFGSYQDRSDENFNLFNCCAAQKPGSPKERCLHNTWAQLLAQSCHLKRPIKRAQSNNSDLLLSWEHLRQLLFDLLVRLKSQMPEALEIWWQLLQPK